MAKQFIYAPINPIWMNPVKDFNPVYNTLPFDFQKPSIFYSQKYKTSQTVKLQCLSDWIPLLKLYDGITGALIATIVAAIPANGIIGQTFTVYEFTIAWNSYPAGAYYTEISYTDDSAIINVWRSGIIQTAANWPGTLVFEYTNSYNDFSAVFSTGIIFTFTVEGNIADFTPAFDDIIYNDQKHNVTKLNAIPRREFNLYIASAMGFAGVPNWVGDKLNWIMACDQIKIDGQYYQNTSGSKWEVSRTPVDGTNFIGLKIGIIEVINLFLQTYQAGQLPAGSIQVITRCLKYLANSANITIPGIFTDNTVLTKIIIYNLGGDIFTMNAGTAADGSAPIASPFTTQGGSVTREIWEINEPFGTASTLYLTGLAGTNCNIFVEYDQLDAPTIAPIVSSSKHAKGTVYMYEEVTVGDFEIHWNIGTGAGNADTDYTGCVISGTNGTKDRNGLLAIGWNPAFPLTRDTLVGNDNNTIVQTPNQVGAHSHLMFNGDTQVGGGNDLDDASYARFERSGSLSRAYIMAKSGTTPTRGSTSTLNLLGAEPMNIANRARVTLFYVCITD